MNNLRTILIAAAFLLIVIQLVMFNYEDFGWAANSGSYLGIVSMVLVIISMILSNRSERNEGKT